jgi:hypothetical protein
MNEFFTFTGLKSEKTEATAISFHSSLTIEFIPLQIFKEFPNINGIFIWTSNIPTLKRNLFPEDFEVILYLFLKENKIKNIEKDSLSNLLKLKWIDLSKNQIESLKENIFNNNIELEYINLNSNKIKMLNPQLFTDLKNIKFIDFSGNICVDSIFQNFDFNLLEMSEKLLTCYTNYFPYFYGVQHKINDDLISSLKAMKRDCVEKIQVIKTEIVAINIKENEFSKELDVLNDRLYAVLDISKCEHENKVMIYKNSDLLMRNDALSQENVLNKMEIILLKGKVEKQRVEMQPKHEEEIRRIVDVKLKEANEKITKMESIL